MPTPHVVVIGGGFGGLSAVRALAHAPVRITLIDRRNHHLFQPLLYQVATAALAPSDIAEPLRGILASQANAEVRLAEVTGIDLAARTVSMGDNQLSYDHLIVAAGATSTWFGHDDWAAHAPGLKTIGDALYIRHRLLSAFERAEWTDDPAERARQLTFVVVGGGPTGVEMAGAIQEIACQTLVGDFRHLDLNAVRVVLVEGSPNLLGPFPDKLRQAARAQLEHMGVEVLTGTQVARIDAQVVQVGDTRIDAGTVVWAAGVRGSPLGAMLGVDCDRGGRVIVGPDTSVPAHPNVYVIGDLANFQHGTAQPLPGVAPVAIDMGKHAAACIRADLVGEPRRPFRYTDKGSLATIGRSLAVASIGPVQLTGFPAWLIWVFVHLMTLVGHRNRLLVFIKWAWAWARSDRSSRLLWRDEPSSGGEPGQRP